MRILLPLCLLLCVINSSAQQLPLYTQYIFNPYMLNPSMVASTNRPELNLLYRQQWSNITDGPKTLQFDGQYRLNDKMGLGIMINQDQTVLLSSTMAMLTYGYRISWQKRTLSDLVCRPGCIKTGSVLKMLRPSIRMIQHS